MLQYVSIGMAVLKACTFSSLIKTCTVASVPVLPLMFLLCMGRKELKLYVYSVYSTLQYVIHDIHE